MWRTSEISEGNLVSEMRSPDKVWRGPQALWRAWPMTAKGNVDLASFIKLFRATGATRIRVLEKVY